MKVAVIDDDPDMLKVIGVILRTHGFEVVQAQSGVDGYHMVRREKPDVVLLDIMMPDIDGYEVCRRLKLDEATSGIPVIFVSAKTGEEHIKKGLSLGAQGYITKPFRPDGLIKKIRELTETVEDPGSARDS